MSKTLFWYLFRDLLKVFLLATVVLACIMSFGGLLRPLTQKGLDLWQVLQILLYLMPAMLTYSIPIASLFAATIVYGRLTADNELTACRAAGLSYLSMALPAIAMGLVISLGSLLFLSYAVPYFSLNVERVMYANVAKYITNEIQSSHEIRTLRGGGAKIYAQGAYVPAAQQGDVQTVVLIGPTIVTEDSSQPGVPASFLMARKATLRIRQRPGGPMLIDGDLEGGVTFGRQGTHRPRGGVEQQHFGPIPIPSRITESVKFMNIDQLRKQASAPETSQRVAKPLALFIASEQQDLFLRDVHARLAAEGTVTFQSELESYDLHAPGLSMTLAPDQLQLRVPPQANQNKSIRLTRRQADGSVNLIADARIATLRVHANNEDSRMQVMVDLQSPPAADSASSLVRLQIGKDLVEKNQHSLPPLSLPMPQRLQDLRQRTPDQYLQANYLPDRRIGLERDMIAVHNNAVAEMHSRASFSLSCLVLVVMGCCMGMIFRSGDFLTAFAVCVIPALAAITLVVAGQQLASGLPNNITSGFRNPLPFALSMIWSGNVLIGLIALDIMRRLHRH